MPSLMSPAEQHNWKFIGRTYLNIDPDAPHPRLPKLRVLDLNRIPGIWIDLPALHGLFHLEELHFDSATATQNGENPPPVIETLEGGDGATDPHAPTPLTPLTWPGHGTARMVVMRANSKRPHPIQRMSKLRHLHLEEVWFPTEPELLAYYRDVFGPKSVGEWADNTICLSMNYAANAGNIFGETGIEAEKPSSAGEKKGGVGGSGVRAFSLMKIIAPGLFPDTDSADSDIDVDHNEEDEDEDGLRHANHVDADPDRDQGGYATPQEMVPSQADLNDSMDVDSGVVAKQDCTAFRGEERDESRPSTREPDRSDYVSAPSTLTIPATTTTTTTTAAAAITTATTSTANHHELITDLQTPPKPIPAEIEGLLSMKKLTNMTIRGHAMVDDAFVQHLADAIPTMERLDVSQSRVSDAGLPALGVMKRLFSLRVSDCLGIRGSGFKNLPYRLWRLEELDLARCAKLQDSALPSICEFRALTSLCLDGCPLLTDTGFKHLHKLELLARLGLQDCYRLGNEGIKALASMSFLNVINVSGQNRMSAHVLSVGITHLTTTLTELNLGMARKVTDKCLASLGCLTALERFNADDCFFSGKGFAKWGKMVRLTEMSLEVCIYLVDEALLHLAKVPKIEKLNLHRAGTGNTTNHFGFTVEGLRHLTKCRALRDLDLTGNQYLSQPDYEEVITEIEFLPELAHFTVD